MEELIKVVNNLQEVFTLTGSKEIDLPQVVVVGTQSSGKSSVLEHIVGRSFLPRGTGVVTRCPLLIQMTNDTKEYAIFQHDSSTEYSDYSLICREIEVETERLAGCNKGICGTPITLKLFSPSFIDLTLVDLPGLTKVPVGDQPGDIEEQTRSLIMEYVKNPNSIILAITPANTDMATSDSIKISREVDPEGKRTLAVVTKIDIMDCGTDAEDILTGKVIPVKLGIVGVINRSQKAVLEGKTIEKSLEDEELFLNKRYPSIAYQHGTPYLKKTVQKILINHIKSCLPKMREDISTQLINNRVKLTSMGDSILDQPNLLLDLLTRFASTYCSAIKGNLSNIDTIELCGGARISRVFQETFSKGLNSIDALEDLPNTAILTAVRNAAGVTPSLFIPEVAFELLVKKQIRSLRIPCLQCIELVNEELNKIGESSLNDSDLNLQRYPKLQYQISKVVNDLLDERVPVASEMINNFVDVQLAFINTANPDIVKKIESVKWKTNNNNEMSKSNKQKNKSYSDSSDSDISKEDCELVKELIESYFSIVRQSIQDTIPKIIMHFLVNYVMRHLQRHLVDKTCRRDAQKILEESPEVKGQRTRLEKNIKALEKATKILTALNYYNLSTVLYVDKSLH